MSSKRTFAAAALLFSGAAAAQSSVTLYGTVGVTMTYLNNVQKAATSPNGRPVGGAQFGQLELGYTGIGPSKWGLLGVEDLGGGLKAIFKLENGFNTNNGTLGQGGAMFGREAKLGLAGSWGEIAAGHLLDSAADFVNPLTFAWNWGNFAAHPGDYDNLNSSHFINNSVKYVSSSWRGFRFGGLYSFGGVAGSLGRNQLWEAGLSYAGGPLSVGAVITNARNPNVSLYGTSANASSLTNNLGTAGSATSAAYNPVAAGFASARTTQVVGLAAKYDIGPASVGLAYSNTLFSGLGANKALNANGYSGTAALNNYEASVRYQVNPVLGVGTSYDYTNAGGVSGQDGAKYHQFNISSYYSLSKSTTLMLLVAYQHATGTNSFGQPAVASISYLSPSATSKQTMVSAGLSHAF